MPEHTPISPSTEIGSLGVYQLKRLWSAIRASCEGQRIERTDEFTLDRQVIYALGLGLHQTLTYLYNERPSFPEFEAWIVATAGEPDPLQVARLNADITLEPQPAPVQRWLADVENSAAVFSADELQFWEDHGYIVLKNAVSPEGTRKAQEAILQHLGADLAKPQTWYHAARNGIMVELIQHPALDANRRAPRIHKAFSQLWGTTDLWPATDRCGFHPPQTDGLQFPGPDLHWDIDLRAPISFGTQALLYLSDTPAEQGALTLVPGFHKRIAAWLKSLPPGADPQHRDLHALGSQPVAGKAADLLIWNSALPHGSRPNWGAKPRIVQYLNLTPGCRVR